MNVYGDLNSGNCLKVKYTADYLKLSYVWQPVDVLQGESRTADYLALNPQGQVPLLQLDDGRCLAQSNAIIRYLAHGSELLPVDPWQQAKIDEWLFWEQYSHEPYIAVCRFHMHYLKKSAQTREPWRVERGEQALDYLAARLAKQDWLAGGGFTIADIALLAYTRLASQGGFDLAGRAPLRAWIERCEEALDLAGI